MSLTPKDLRDEAARLRRQADVLDEAAQALEGRLPQRSTSVNNESMTQAQALRRGASNARNRAKHPIARAIVDSKWGSVSRYAKGRLRISQSSMSLYLRGIQAAPVEVMDKVKADFGFPDTAWPNPERRL